ncbi:MAG: hypothetical protein A2Z29_06505 [Chloroflexi bacterium RBG_16_56_11]|nr:MAG: hypothetical protein A2Z29_06505 [Chloroflexi bacterium RBG_16_56_11]
MPKNSPVAIVVLVGAVLFLSFGGGYLIGVSRVSDGSGGQSASSNLSDNQAKLDIVNEAWDIVFTDYVDQSRLNSDNLSRAAIEGIITALDDPYTAYLEPDLYDLGVSSFEGEFEGIGAFVTMENRQLTIAAPIVGSPAEKAGIRAGDTVLEINGASTANMTLAEAIIKIRGPEGSSVKLLVLHRDETDPVAVDIIRANIEVPSVRFEMRGDIAHITITDFTARTESEMSPVIQDLKKNGARGIVLDLRHNPGGLLDAVVKVASHFIKQGAVTRVMSNQGITDTYEVSSRAITTDLPLVVLVDEASASGSEVLSGALQDHDRAFVAGNVTYGKGSVNVLRRLSDGSGLYITTARWLTPDGHMIEGQGIEPDRILEVTGEDAVQWAIDYLGGNP